MVRYNTDTSCLEQYTSNGWVAIAAPPTITSVSPSTYNGEQGTTFTINGTSFDGSPTVKFIDNAGIEYSAGSITRNSTSQLTATTPQDFTVAQEPLKVKVTNSSGLTYTLDNAIDCGGVPTWTTAAGNVANIVEGVAMSTVTLQAGDPDSGATISYAIASGALPTGLSFNTSSGAITGTSTAGGSYSSGGTTYNITVNAIDNAGNTTARAFNIIRKWKDGSTSAQAANSAYAIAALGANQNTNGTPNLYYINTPGGVKQIYCKFYGDNYGWMLSHTFGGTNALTTNDNYCLVKGGFWMTTEQMGNLPASYSLSGTMSTTKDTKLRFSDGSNNYQTTAGSSTYWSLEGTVNNQGASYGSSNPYFFWWAHSGNIGHLHIYGDLSGVYPSNTTHALWEGEMQVASSPQSFIADYQGNAIYNNSGSNAALITIPSTIRAPLGPLNGTGSHGYWSDGNGTTEQTRALWVGSSS
jgi:hypothetical protein